MFESHYQLHRKSPKIPLAGSSDFLSLNASVLLDFRGYFPSTLDIKTTVSTWHEEMILLAHTSYLFAQCRTGTYPPFWALGCSPMQEHIDKLEFNNLPVCRSHSTPQTSAPFWFPRSIVKAFAHTWPDYAFCKRQCSRPAPVCKAVEMI